MVSARLPVVDALDTSARQTTHKTLSAALHGVASHVRSGSTLSSGFVTHGAVFGPLAAGLVRVGEASGALGPVLIRIADALERTAELRRRVQYALAYPAVVLSVAVGAVSFLLTVVVPTFADLFADFDAPLPWPTRVLISVSSALRAAAPFLLVGLVVSVWAARRFLQTARGRRIAEGVTLRIPFVGTLYRQLLTARFCRTLATLLEGGVPLAEALAVTADAEPSPRSSDAARALRDRIVRGGTLAGRDSSSLGLDVDLFPPMVAQMVAVGEATARLAETLDYAAAHYERQVEGATDALSSVIEPILVLVLGVVVGAILVAIYLPMFDLVTTVQ